MVSSKQVPLSEAYWFQEGPGVRNWQFTTSGVKLLNVGNITKDGNIDLDKTDKHISLDEAEGKYSHFLVDEGDLVIASSGISFDEDGMLRTRGAFIEKKHLPLCLNTSTIRFKAIEGVSDLNFFKFWLDSFEFRDQVSRLVTGSAQQNFGPSHLKIINISLPLLTEQKRIASLLARADRLRQLRRTAHDLGDALLQSVFLEMFGDMVRNDKGWKIMSLGQTCDEIYRYPTFYGFDYVEEGVPVVRIGDILMNGEVNPNLENYVRIAPEINKRFPRTILELGDILMAVRGDGSTGKRIGIVKSKNLVGSNISPNLLRFKAKEKYVSSSFLFTFMTSSGGQELIDRYITRTAKKTITSTDIQTIKIPVPPLSLQEEFSGVVARVESLRGRMGESARQVEGLFESLLTESFA